MLHDIGFRIILRDVEGQHRLFLMRNRALDFYVAQGRGREEPTGKGEYIRQRLFVFLLVDCGPAHHAFDGDLRSQRGHHYGVATLQALHVALHPMEEQVIDIYVLYEFVSATALPPGAIPP